MGISQVRSGLLIKLLHPEELSFSLSWQVSLTNKKCVLNIYTAWKFPFCFCNSSFLYIYTVACLTIVQVGLSQPCLLTTGMLPEYLDSSILVPTFQIVDSTTSLKSGQSISPIQYFVVSLMTVFPQIFFFSFLIGKANVES